jgi:dTDP-4-dehydrorhamnose 3,5-epimerase
MIFKETKLPGAFILELERFEDERGFFALSWSQEVFAERGLESRFVECDISFNRRKATLRGMHFQAEPHGQAKLVRCTMGSVYDVIVDLRPGSPTFRQWATFELSAQNRLLLYVPVGFAHGFLTLEDNTEVFYQMSQNYHPKSGRGARWNDPAFKIQWPMTGELIINERDKSYPDFVPESPRA